MPIPAISKHSGLPSQVDIDTGMVAIISAGWARITHLTDPKAAALGVVVGGVATRAFVVITDTALKKLGVPFEVLSLFSVATLMGTAISTGFFVE